jgi:hypothetical protein
MVDRDHHIARAGHGDAKPAHHAGASTATRRQQQDWMRPAISERSIERDKTGFEQGFVRWANDQWLLYRTFYRWIPDGDTQLVAPLRVAQDGRLLGRETMHFADRIGVCALERQES